MTWQTSKFRGVRFRLHSTRKFGAMPDRYFAVRYQHDDGRHEEGLGWASQGWSEQKAALKLAELKEAAKTGKGPARLSEARAMAEEERKAALAAKEALANDRLTFGQFWRMIYFPQCQLDKKPETVRREKSLYKQWLGPAVGSKPLKQIAPTDMERLKHNMAKAGLAPRSIEYALALARQVFNKAKAAGVYFANSPTSQVRKPSKDNRRTRFLTPDEARELLDALWVRSPEAHDMSVLGLACGLRFGEVAGLTWGCVDKARQQLMVKDGKNGRSRIAYLTADAMAMLERRGGGHHDQLIFPAKDGGPHKQISAVFWRVLNQLGWNKNVSDPRDKVVYHTLRHSFASWLVQDGTPLYTVQKLLGHSTISQTERYSHLHPDHMKSAVQAIERAMEHSLKGEVANNNPA